LTLTLKLFFQEKQTNRGAKKVKTKQSNLTGLIVVSLHHPKVHGRAGLRHGPLPLGGVALGPVGPHPHLLHARKLRRRRRTPWHMHGVGDSCKAERRGALLSNLNCTRWSESVVPLYQ